VLCAFAPPGSAESFRQIGNVSAGERALEGRDLTYVERRRTIADALSQVTRERARLDRAK
jgi:hypothetical protein